MGVHTPPAPAWANFSIIMECSPECGRCHSMCTLWVPRVWDRNTCTDTNTRPIIALIPKKAGSALTISTQTFRPLNVSSRTIPHMSPEMEIIKNKNPQASIQIFCRFLNPYPSLWIFLEITDLAKVSRLLVRKFFLEIFTIHRLVPVWIFLWIFGCFESVFCLIKVITGTIYKFYKRCFIKDYLWRHICIIGWCLVRQRNP